VAKERGCKRDFPEVTIDWIRRINRLIPYRQFESITARSDKLAIAILQRFFGPEWSNRHVETSRSGFIRMDNSDPARQETQRMRRIMLVEMLYNFQRTRGFRSCLKEMAGGQIESTYATLEVGRLLRTQALDRNLDFRFVTPSGIPKEVARRDYDLSIRFSDGTVARAEAKCKLEETKITIRTVDETLSRAKSQLPERVPCMVFVKVPHHWLNDATFKDAMLSLADRFLARSPFIVSVKYHTMRIDYFEEQQGQTISEVILVNERMSPSHKFQKLNKNWTMFPSTPSSPPPPRADYNGMPDTWQRLLVRDTNL
jgi:Tfp pilus assembly protein PilV